MTVGGLIKRCIQVLAGLGLATMFLLPVALTWADDHPESALMIALSGVDRDAGIFTQIEQFVTGASKAEKMVAEATRDKAEDAANREIERKQAESRRFNEGSLNEYDDYATH